MLEYNPNYRVSTYLKALRDIHQKLFEDDLIQDPALERMICCHILEKDDTGYDRILLDSEKSSESNKKSKKLNKKQQ